MIVSDLIAILQTMPPDAPVVCPAVHDDCLAVVSRVEQVEREACESGYEWREKPWRTFPLPVMVVRISGDYLGGE